MIKFSNFFFVVIQKKKKKKMNEIPSCCACRKHCFINNLISFPRATMKESSRNGFFINQKCSRSVLSSSM